MSAYFAINRATARSHGPCRRVSVRKRACMGSSPAPIPFARSMLRQHRHVCAFFNSANDEYSTLLPFICEGISCGHRAFHVLPSKHRREHLDRLTAAGVDVAATQNSGQLEVAASEDTYTRGGIGFPLTRLVAHAETTCADWGGVNEFMEYEMRLNEVLPNYDDPVICAYDANLVDANLAIDILRTHPVAVIGGVLVENSFFSRPEDFLREVRARSLTPPSSYLG